MLKDILISADRYCDRPAIVINEKSYTYKELFTLVKQLYSKLILIKDIHIGILAENKIETYAAILAVLYSGKTYIMIHPDYPIERNTNIINQTNIKFIMHSDEVSDLSLSFLSSIGMNINHLTKESYDLGNCNLYDKLESEDDAYIIFTSGSTGTPKGVPISRQNLSAFYQAYKELGWNIDENDRVLQMFELTFDVSVVSFLFPLSLGASVYTISTQGFKYLNVLDTIETYKITFAAVAPSVLRLSKSYFQSFNWPFLRYLILTAEASDLNLISDFRQCIPNAEIINLYGPTEATIYCSCYKVPKENVKNNNGLLAIGKPFKNLDILILDESNNEVYPGTKGELLVAGPQIMRGYLHLSVSNTQTCFFMRNGKRYYRTGDICLMDKDGILQYFGRLDQQVKIQGFRIEMGEIEYAGKCFYNHKVNMVAVLTENEYGAKAIKLVVEKDVTDESERLALLSFISGRLPHYMVPDEIIYLPFFPLNSNDKIDKKQILKIITL